MKNCFLIRYIIVLLLCCSRGVTAADNPVDIEADANGSKHWRWEGRGIGIEFVQVAPDFIRASYSSRGLPKSVAEAVATRCVFGSIIRNLSDKPLTYHVSEWRYTDKAGKTHSIKPKSEWLKEWHAMGVRFSWSILADNPTFDKGDWIQGFTTMPEPHGSKVDIHVVWHIAGNRYSKTMTGLECAPPPSK